uniref:dUTPase-like domain-containing protein n=1 Tax=Catharus ustulatus TaxID=91951 RepID=A0A8C3UA08_CATUS
MQSLQPATAGSLGLDLAAAVDVTFMQGLFVLPGVIDSDYTGELMIMAFTLFPPFTITKGQHIAQIIPLPQLTKGIAPLCQQPRQDKGFGSTGNSSHRRRLIPSSGCWQNFR